MITASPPITRAGAVVATAALAVTALVLPADAASAATGSAPAPVEYRVLADIHTDAVSTFLDDGQLTLATKADVPEGNHTRFGAEDVWFHVDNDAKMTWPAGFEFVAAEGAEVWLAPEVQNPDVLWPGFSTESVPAGTFDGNTTTLTLVDVDGPGDVELWTSGVFGGANRIWSTDEDLKVQVLNANQHKHANWAFTAPGIYEITIRADATIGGAPQTDTATYTFVVGDLPEQVVTAVTLDASSSSVTAGDPITFSADVGPGGSQPLNGAVEFREGSTVLGHDTIDESGSAELTVSDLSVGNHTITAVFVPTTVNLALGSTSGPITVAVTSGSGQSFAITGLSNSYTPGETLAATATGYSLGDGEVFRWMARQVGTTTSFRMTGGGQEAAGRLTFPIDMRHDDYELSVQVRRGSTTVAQSSWVPLSVHSDVQALTPTFPSGPMYLGDELFVELDGDLAEGDAIRVAQRGSSGAWYDYTEVSQLDEDTLQLKPTWSSTGVAWTVETVRNGVVVAHSEPVAKDVLVREVQVEGLQEVYRAGQTLRAQATIYPPLEGLTYTWMLERSLDEAPYYESRVVKEGTSESDLSLELPIEAGDDGWTLVFVPSLPYGHPSGATEVGGYLHEFHVSDSSAETQLLFFRELSGHYHQGSTISLDLIADPALADGDTLSWQWKWPTSDEWATVPGATGLSHQLTAEQALDGVEVRALLALSDGGEQIIAEPVTIVVDDHGTPARQVPSVAGETSYSEGEPLNLSLSLPTNGQTILTDIRWEKQTAGSDEWTTIEDASSTTLSTPTTLADAGASYRVSILTPAGQVAYGPSAPVSIEVIDVTSLTLVGIEDSYSVGDTLTGTAVGVTLGENDVFRWLIQYQGTTRTIVPQSTTSPTFSYKLSALHDDAEIQVAVYNSVSRSYVSESAWVPIVVEHEGTQPTITAIETDADPLLPGDSITYEASGYDLADGESFEWGFSSYAGYFGSVSFGSSWSAEYLNDEHSRVRVTSKYNSAAGIYRDPLVVSVVRDGVYVNRSELVPVNVGIRELLVSGHQNLYRVGSQVSVDASLYPVRAGDNFTYTWTFTKGDSSEVWGESQRSMAAITGPVLDKALHNGGKLQLSVYNNGKLAQQSSAMTLNVTDDLTKQILLFNTLADHYHQGNAITLNLTVDPAPVGGDSVQWQWMWPNGDWENMPGVVDNSWSAVAEQALDGVQVRAVLTYADAGAEPAISEVRTIHVDDHGAAARQVPSVAGETSYSEGEPLDLSLSLPTNGQTILTDIRWEKQTAGSDEWTTIEDASSTTLSTPTTLADAGASYRVSILTPAGQVAYGPSAPVTIAVEESEGDPGSGTEDPDSGTEDPDSGTDQPGSGNEKPATAPPARTGDDLGSTSAGGIGLSATALAPGQSLTIDLGADHAGEWVAAWMFSTPTLLTGDWILANGSGTVSVVVPADAPVGDHRIAVFASDGTLVGWAAVTITADGGASVTGLSNTGGTLTTQWIVLPTVAILGGVLLLLLRRTRRDEA